MEPRRSSRSNKGQHSLRDFTVYLSDDDDSNKGYISPDDDYVDKRKLEDRDLNVEDDGDDVEEEDEKIQVKPKRHKPNPVTSSTTSLKDKIRANVAKAFANVLKTQIPDTYQDDGKSKDETVLNWSMRIEAVIFSQFPQKDKYYTDKSRGIMTLLKKPNVLQRLMDKTLTFEKLVLSSPEEIDEDLKIYAEKVRQESIRRSVLLSNEDSGQRIRRTHKGEEIVEDVSDAHRQEDEVNIVSKSVDHRRFDDDSDTPPKVEKKIIEEAKEVGNNFNYNTAGLDDEDYNYSDDSFGAEGTPELDDNDLDKILEKQEPQPPKPAIKSAMKKSTQLPDMQSTNVWQGRITFPDFATFKASLTFITATNYTTPKTPLDAKLHNSCINVSKDIFSRSFYDIEGKLDRRRADPYLNQVASSKDFYLYKLKATDDFEDYEKLFKYFISHKKVGVLSGKPQFAKDAYIIAVDGEIPSYLLSLSNTSSLLGLYALYIIKKDYQSGKPQPTRTSVPKVQYNAPPKRPSQSDSKPSPPQQSSVLDSILSKLGGSGGSGGPGGFGGPNGPGSSGGDKPKSGPNLPPKPTFTQNFSNGLSSDQMGMLSSIVQQNPQMQNNPQALAQLLEQQKYNSSRF